MEASVAGTIIQTFNPDYFRAQADNEAYETFRVIVDRIKVHRAEKLCRFAVSFGKDSKLMLMAGLQAHLELVRSCIISADSPLIVTNIDTGVEDIFVKAQVAYEKDQLRKYCAKVGINLVLRTASPPLRYTWAVMYLSGMKLPSFAKSSADCSVILKVDPAKALERELAQEFGEDMITVLGVRNEESSRRRASIKRHGLDDVNVIEKIVNNKRVLSLAPIIDLDTDDVFAILRRAGTAPIVRTNRAIPCYTPNNALLIKLYGDAQDTCPVSSFQSPAAEAKRGSCGTGSRFGCYTCLKVVKDKSADARKRYAQYDRVAKVSLIRDWMAHTADDMSLRASVGKSTCPVTGAIVVQRNTYNAETLEKLIYWFAQASLEDAIYAEAFSKLVAEGRLHDDAGYTEILNDDSIDEEFKLFYLDYYVQMSQRHLVQPLTLEQVLMICAIHARDGVALPPYRALWIWNEVHEGRYIPWPVIGGEPEVNEVPEPRFFFGDLSPTINFGLLNVLASDETACSVSYSDHNSAGRYTKSVTLGELIIPNPKPAPVKHAFSRRKTRKIQGRLEKGRMSVQFSPVDSVSAHVANATKEISIIVPSKDRVKSADIEMVNFDDVDAGFSLNIEAVFGFQMTEYDRCIEKHDEFVACNGITFGGTAPFLSMVHYGLVSLTDKAAIASERILNRTNALSLVKGGLSVLNMSEEELQAITVSQAEFRTIKAKRLIQIRQQRRVHKAQIRQCLAMRQQNGADYIETQGTMLVRKLEYAVEMMAHELGYLNALENVVGLTYFDSVHLATYKLAVVNCMTSLSARFGSIDAVLALFSEDRADVTKRMAAACVVSAYIDMLKRIVYSDNAGTLHFLARYHSVEVSCDIQRTLAPFIPNYAEGNVICGKKPLPITSLTIFGF